MTEKATKAPGSLFYAGIVLIVISSVCYFFNTATAMGDQPLGLFALSYVLTLGFFFVMWARKQWEHLFIFLVLFLISAYSLNRQIPVFERSAGWLTVLLVISCINYVFLGYRHAVPRPVKQLMYLVLGVSTVLFLYMSVYLLPLYAMSIAVSFALGLSLHSFVPLLFLIFSIREIVRIFSEEQRQPWGLIAGVALPVAIAAVFCLQWNSVNNIVSKEFGKTLYADNTELPSWMKVAQMLPDNAIAEKYLKAELVYSMPSGVADFFNWGMPHTNLDEVRKHDPLVMIAGFFCAPPVLSADDRIKILESLYISRHYTQDRLWSGDNLRTRGIVSNIRIWPRQRIAYTEKTITIQNVLQHDHWDRWNREEAIYTFHLPEGGVVTSLSLWIDGREHKAVLTKKGKADSAYKEIVGVEYRDPSLVHWLEGNTVSVRVFPVTAGDTRIFKIGVTAPLTDSANRLRYDNIGFEGPGLAGATETCQVDWVEEPKGFEMPSGFTQNGHHRYIREGRYDADMKLSFDDPGMLPATFSFNGNGYTVGEYVKHRDAADFRTVYLDLNSSWTPAELDEAYRLLHGKDVYVFNDGLVKLTDKNKDTRMVTSLLQRHFSIFPFQEITDPATSLVVTKNTYSSPSLADLKGSDFADSLASKLADGRRIRLFNLGTVLSPYLKGLKEHRTFDFEQGSLPELAQLIRENKFARNIEDDNHIVIDNANIELTKAKDSVAGNGPDHLMRLFAYNHLMSQLKTKLFANAEGDSTLVEEAEQANIVTPLSSLIVLESQQDYDRFKIARNNNSLDNASLKSNGAVPEPHEWALIILACIALIYAKRRKLAYARI